MDHVHVYMYSTPFPRRMLIPNTWIHKLVNHLNFATDVIALDEVAGIPGQGHSMYTDLKNKVRPRGQQGTLLRAIN